MSFVTNLGDKSAPQTGAVTKRRIKMINDLLGPERPEPSEARVTRRFLVSKIDPITPTLQVLKTSSDESTFRVSLSPAPRITKGNRLGRTGEIIPNYSCAGRESINTRYLGFGDR